MGDDDWSAVVGNCQKSRNSWGRLSRILIREGGRSEGVGAFFQGCDSGGVVVWSGDVGTDPQDEAGLEYFSNQGLATAHWEASEETGGWELGIPLIGGGNGGSRLRGDWDILQEEAEYSRALYCNATDYGHL